MSTDATLTLPVRHTRRGVIRASVTRLDARVAELEKKERISPGDLTNAQCLQRKLDELDQEFRTYHFAVIDLTEEDATEPEQALMDEHDDKVGNLSTCIQLLADKYSSNGSSSSTDSNPNRTLTRCLNRIEKNLKAIMDEVDALATGPDTDTCILRQYEDQMGGLKAELVHVSTDLLALEEEDDDLSKKESTLSKTRFDVCLKLKRLLQDRAATPSTTPSSALLPAPTGEGSGIRLRKLDVLTFDGDLVHWASFWEQFTISVHGRKDLTDLEKLAYLQNAVKDGLAKHVVEGLSCTGERYKEAVDTLRKRYDRPRLIHQAHVRAIFCAPALKTGSGKELRRLHDTLVQHLRALKAMKSEPSGSS